MTNAFEDETESIILIVNKYTSLPTAEALIPINPARLPAYYMGSVLASDQRIKKNDVLQPLINLESSLEYLSSSNNDDIT